MTENKLKSTWKKLMIPCLVWMVLLIIAVLFNRLGSKEPIPQTVSLIASVHSLTFTIFYSIKIIKFKKNLKYLNNH